LKEKYIKKNRTTVCYPCFFLNFKLSQKIGQFIRIAQTDQTPLDVTNCFVNYSLKITQKTRSFMEKNPKSPEPKVYKQFPGKMDHTTCITIKIRDLESESSEINKNRVSEKSPSIANKHLERKSSTKSGHNRTKSRIPSVSKVLRKKKKKILGISKIFSQTHPSMTNSTNFLKEQFAEENLEFYHLITNFEKSQKTGKELSEEANHILCKYLGFGDTGMKGMIISISPSIYQELKKVFEEKNYSIRMFSKIRIEVGQLLETLFVEFKQADKTKDKRKLM